MATFGRSSGWIWLENSAATKKPLRASQKPAAAIQKLGNVVQKPTNRSLQRQPLRQPNRIAAPKASNLEADLKKATEQCRRLREEVANLRQEIAALKEDGLRQRMLQTAATSETVTSHAAPETTSQRTKEMSMAHSSGMAPLMLTLFASIVVVIGVLVGKWLF
ncbi:uncharacterized protein LOC142777207 [Rhipicephalus microplus]|uniref:uncharacterized protein LOC142777207 n=1 Tax=Rhipicephalus microplus TaxID=6941 RepID=UPI003F6CC475